MRHKRQNQGLIAIESQQGNQPETAMPAAIKSCAKALGHAIYEEINQVGIDFARPLSGDSH